MEEGLSSGRYSVSCEELVANMVLVPCVLAAPFAAGLHHWCGLNYTHD